MKNKILTHIAETEALLEPLKGNEWAEVWCNKKMEFYRLFHEGLITSTSYGADFFDAVKSHLNGSKLPPMTPMMGEYELNYRTLIKRWLTN